MPPLGTRSSSTFWRTVHPLTRGGKKGVNKDDISFAKNNLSILLAPWLGSLSIKIFVAAPNPKKQNAGDATPPKLKGRKNTEK
jgi:hypothetical protein